jgi:hypothetical protein
MVRKDAIVKRRREVIVRENAIVKRRREVVGEDANCIN